jgi:hypothetical protein
MSFGKIFFLIFISQSIYCQVINVDLIPSKDNSIFSESGSESSGKGLYIFAGRTYQNTKRRGLLKFDLSTIPANAIIVDASLSIPVLRSANNTTAAHSFSIHKLTNDFGEGTSIGIGNGVPATLNDATWTQNFYTISNWTNLGADFIATASATTNAVLNDYAVWNGNLKIDVQNWLTNPTTNFGWLIKGDENTAGSAKGFASKDNTIFQPILTISYTVPIVENVFINEINPKKQWIEIYNPSSNTVDLSTYFLKNNTNQIQITASMILNGNISIQQGKYTILNWNQISLNDGEIAFYKGNPTISGSEMKDYFQYGSANHSMANMAVNASVWDNINAFLPTISLDSMSYSIKGNVVYTSGKNTNSTSFIIQRETPTFINQICPNQINLTNQILDAKYTATNEITINGQAMPSKKYQLKSQKSITILPNSIIPDSTIFEAKIGGCW